MRLRYDEQDALDAWLSQQERDNPRPDSGEPRCECCGSDEVLDGYVTCAACHAAIDDGSDVKEAA